MFNSAGHTCTITHNLLWASPSSLCRGYQLFWAVEVLVTSYTDCLILPKPSFPISTSSVEPKQKITAVPVGQSVPSRLLMQPGLTSPFPLENQDVFLHTSCHHKHPWQRIPPPRAHLQSSLLNTYLVPGRVFPHGQPGTFPILWLGAAHLENLVRFRWGPGLCLPSECWIWSTGLLVFISCSLSLFQNLCAAIPSILPMPKWVIHGLHSFSSCWSKIPTPYGKSQCGYPHSSCSPFNE